MSTTIDSKIVEMRFDNKQFEQNVQTSIESTEKLKKSLAFDGVAKGFENIQSASKNVNFQAIGDAIDSVRVKFSALEVMAITALANITNRAVNAGISLSKSLSIDQVTAGWSKYAQKTSSVQTIMAATNSSWQVSADELARIDKLLADGMEKSQATRLAATYSQIADGTMSVAEASKKLGMSKSDLEKYAEGLKDVSYSGTQMEFVSDQLGKLNWFSDETSYSFTDMTNNIGKFTSAGQKLTDSVTAMQGISTWAALSGANVEQASRAMYNLSQALGTGSVKLIDWKSIENANMATAEFKQTVLDTAVELGMLKKTSEGLYATLDKGTEVSVKNFNASLAEGWFSNDVLMATLDKYGKFTDKLYEASEKTGLTATQLIKATDKYKEGTLDLSKVASQTGLSVEELTGMFKELGSETYDLGRRAFKAAQEAKTFQEAIDATKDAVSTGWMNTFELIFGNYEEAKELWTNVANELYDIFAASAEARNELLGGWKELGGRTAMLEAFANAWNGIKSVIEPIKEAFRDIFPPMTAKRLVEITEHIRDITAKFKLSDEAAENLKNTFKGLFAIVDIFLRIGKAAISIIVSLLGFLPKVGGGILGITGNIGKAIAKFDEFIKESKILENIVTKVTQAILDFKDSIYVSFIEGGGGITGVVEVMFDVLADFVRGMFSLISKLTGIDFSGVSENIVTGIQKVRNFVVDHLEGLITFGKEFPDRFKAAFQKITGVNLGDAFEKLKEKISGAYQSIKESIEGFRGIDTSGMDELGEKVHKRFAPITAIFEGLKVVFGAIIKVFKKLAPLFAKLAEIFGKALTHFGNAVSDGIDAIDMDALLDLVNGGILTAIALGVKKIMDTFSGIGKDASGILKGITGVLDGVKDSLKAWQQNLKAKTLMTIATAIGVLTAALVVLSFIDKDKLSSAMAAITAEFVELMTALKMMTKTMNGADGKNMSKASTTMIKLSVAVLILSVAMKSLSELDYEGIARGGIAIAALSAILVKTSQAMSKNEKKVAKGTAGMIAFAVAIRLLVKPTKELGALDTNSLIKGLGGVFAIITSLALFFKTTDLSGMSVNKGVGILVLAEAIKVLGKSVKSFGELDSEVLLKGLSSVILVLASLASFVTFTGDAKKVTSTATGLVILGAAMLVFQKAIEKMGNLSWEQIGKGLATMAATLVVVGVAINNMPKSTGLIATGLVIMASALVILGAAVKQMGNLSWEQIGKGLLTMSAALAVVAIALNAMKGTIGGSIAMLIMATSLMVLVPVLKILGNMDLMEIGRALLALAGVFTVIGVAAHVLAPVIPAILGLAAAIALLGVAVLACGAGLLLFATAMTVFSAAGTAGIAVFVLAIEALFSLLPQFAKRVGEGILEIIRVVAAAAPELILAAKDSALGILETAMELVPKILDVLDKLLAALAEHMPSLSKSIVKIVKHLIDILSSLMGDIVELVIDTVLKILKALENKMPDIVQAAFDLVIAFIDGLGEAMVKNAARLRDAILNLFKNMFKAVLEFFGIHSPSKKFFDVGVNIILGLIKGLLSIAVKLISTIVGIMVDLVKAVGEKIGEFFSKGKEIIGNIISGIGDKAKELWDNITGVIGDAVSAIGDKLVDFLNFGKDIITNIGAGLESMGEFFKTCLSGVVEFALNGVKLLGSLLGKIKDLGEWVGNKVGEGLGKARDFLKSCLSSAIELAANGVKFVAGLLGKVKAVGEWLGSKIGEGAKAVKDVVQGAVEWVCDKAIAGVKTIQKLWDKAVEIGEWLGKGIKRGFEKAKDWILGSGNSLAGSILEKYEKEMKINSPSKVMEQEGIWTMLGLANGLSKTTSTVLTTMDDSGNKMIDSMSGIVSRIYDEFNQDVDYEPTITPVLDLTNIQNGAGLIDGMLSTDKSINLATNADIGVNQNLKENNQNAAAIEELKGILKDAPKGDEITNVNNTFNIQSDNPKEVADEVSRRIQKTIERRDAVWA